MNEIRYKNDDKINILGHVYTIRVFATGGKGVSIAGDTLHLKCPIGADASERKRIMYSYYKETLSAEIIKLAPVCEDITGKKAAEWHIRDMKTRWGTCNINDARIWISLDLIHYDTIYLKYIMIHELTHLYERLHNDRFYTYMDLFLPNWRDIKKSLNAAATSPDQAAG